MAEVEEDVVCNNCGSKFKLIYETDQVSYDPENCPFCAEIVNLNVDDDFDNVELDDSDWLDDDIDKERIH